MLFLSNIIEFIACCFNLLFYILTFNTFLVRKTSRFSLVSILSMICFLSVTFLPESVLPNVITSSLGVLFMMIYLLICYEGNILKRLTIILLFNIFDIITTSLIYYSFQHLLDMNVLESIEYENYDRIYYLITIYLVQTVVLYIIRLRVKKTEVLSVSEYLIPILFFASNFVIVTLSHYMLYSPNLTGAHISFYCMLICLLMLFCTFFVLFLFHQISRHKQIQAQHALFEVQIEQQEKQIRQFQANTFQLHRIRHDMKNYLLTYQSLLQRGDIEQVLKDIRQMLDERLVFSESVYTDNSLLNALLLSRASLCYENRITLQIHINIPSDYQDIETMVAILNLFDNAIEAELKVPQDKRLIIIEIVSLSSGLSIIFQNSIITPVLQNSSSLNTTKSDTDCHGIGLKSVRHLVEKRHGLIDIYEEGLMFTVHIMFV